jgi:hypothetical protein
MTDIIIQKLESVCAKFPSKIRKLIFLEVIKPPKKEETKFHDSWDIWKKFKELRKKVNDILVLLISLNTLNLGFSRFKRDEPETRSYD